MKRLFFVLIFLSFSSITALSYDSPAVHKALTEAKKSIFLVMYYIEFRKQEPDSKVSILVDDLIKAKEKE